MKMKCEEELTIFQQRLKILLKENGGNITRFAEQKLEIQRATLSNYLNGRRKPETDIIIKICRVCNISADWLLGMSDIRSVDGVGLTDEKLEMIHDATIPEVYHNQYNPADDVVACTPCLVCGESVPLKRFESGQRICNECKEVILRLRKQ